jgi:D-alanyl-D-alanine carboxypeptidase
MKITILAFCFLFTIQLKAQTAEDSIINFIKAHPSTSSFFAIKNNKVLGNYNENTVMPMANMYQLLVAMEFAKQATYKIIDTAERINLKQVVKYYFENANVDNYEQWLGKMLMQKKVQNNTISLMEICNGMMEFGVLANTEYLMDKIGFDNIKSSIQSYNLKNHDAILPPVGALAMFQNRTNITEKKMLKSIDLLTEEGYCKLSFVMHLAVRNDSTFKAKIPKNFATPKVLETWSDRLPQATTKSYATLLQNIVEEKMLDAKYYKMLRKVLELKNNTANINNKWDRYLNFKTNTHKVFANAIFCKAKDSKETVLLVYTCYNLKPNELAQLQLWQSKLNDDFLITSNFQQLLQNTILAATPK